MREDGTLAEIAATWNLPAEGAEFTRRVPARRPRRPRPRSDAARPAATRIPMEFDWDIFWEALTSPAYAAGAALTIGLAVAAQAAAGVIGLVVALLRGSPLARCGGAVA